MPIAARSSADAPNTAISSMLKRWRETDRDRTSAIDRTSETGSPLAWRSCSCTAALTLYGRHAGADDPRDRRNPDVQLIRRVRNLRLRHVHRRAAVRG